MSFLLSPLSALEEDNYLMKDIFSYLEFFHYFKLSVPTFVELYPIDAIRCIKENDVRFWTLFKTAPWHVPLVFVEISQHL
jgi:hypothetical protein